MANIPRYAYDLIDLLDESEREPKFPRSVTQAMGMDEAQIRRGVWYAARRALVDELIAMRQEDEDEATGNQSTPSDDPGSILETPILDPSGAVHFGVAPTHMAPPGPATD